MLVVTPERHQEFAERITRSLEKVTVTDYEAVIEASMLAGTHWFNVALHKMKLSVADNDVLHIEFMVVHERLKAWLMAPRMVEALERIENMRGLHVRGNAEGGEKAATDALHCLGLIRETALDAVPLGLTSPQLGHVSLND